MQANHVPDNELKPEPGRSGEVEQDQAPLRHRRLKARRTSRADDRRQTKRLADVLASPETEPLQAHAGAGNDKTGQGGGRCHSDPHCFCLNDA